MICLVSLDIITTNFTFLCTAQIALSNSEFVNVVVATHNVDTPYFPFILSIATDIAHFHAWNAVHIMDARSMRLRELRGPRGNSECG